MVVLPDPPPPRILLDDFEIALLARLIAHRCEVSPSISSPKSFSSRLENLSSLDAPFFVNPQAVLSFPPRIRFFPRFPGLHRFSFVTHRSPGGTPNRQSRPQDRRPPLGSRFFSPTTVNLTFGNHRFINTLFTLALSHFPDRQSPLFGGVVSTVFFRVGLRSATRNNIFAHWNTLCLPHDVLPLIPQNL